MVEEEESNNTTKPSCVIERVLVPLVAAIATNPPSTL